jgi:hypothetical protein
MTVAPLISKNYQHKALQVYSNRIFVTLEPPIIYLFTYAKMLNVGGDEQVNMDPDDDRDWLHRNETFQANNIVASNDLLTTGT